VPGRTGAAAAALLGDEGVELRGVEVGGEIRSAAIVLEGSGRVTVMNEPGPALPRATGRASSARWPMRFLTRGPGVQRLAAAGAPDDAYGALVALARRRARWSVVDVGGLAARRRRSRRRRRGDAEPRRGRGAAARRADETVEAGDRRRCASARWRRRGRWSSAGAGGRW
jgi:hypothetical protein